MRIVGLYIILLGCSGLSAYLTIDLSTSFRGESFVSAAGLLGLLIEAGKVAFGGYALGQGKGLRKIAVGILWITLMAISGVASYTYIHTSTLRQHKAELETSTAYREALEALQSAQKRVAIVQGALETYQRMGMATRALEGQRELIAAIMERDTYAASLKALRLSASASAPVAAWENATGAVVALLLELVPLGIIIILQDTRTVTIQDATPKAKKDTTRHPPRQKVAAFIPTIVADTLEDRAERLLRSGKCSPSYDDLKKQLKIGSNEAQRVMAAMRERGVVRKEGNKHKMAA